MTQIKSGYFYLTQLLTKLVRLEHISIYSIAASDTVKPKCVKSLFKGLNNLIEAGGKVRSLGYFNLNV